MAAAASAPDAVTPVYRHYRKDFGPLQTKPLHLDLEFDMLEERVRVTSRTTFLHAVDAPLTVLKLNSRDLDIESVELLTGFKPLASKKPSSAEFVSHVASFAQGTLTPVKFEVDTKDHFLVITLPQPVSNGEEFVIRIVSVAKPTAHILEGLYYDFTPEGQPKTIITQCQQHGFQRIVPSLDAMTAKAYYTTRIIADKRYTHFISNGDLAPGFFDEAGEPRPRAIPGDDARVLVEYHNHKVNMASYLFFLGVGTYEQYRGEVEYCDGSRFFAELLVFPKITDPVHASSALQSLINSIYWCNLSTGPEATQHQAEREQIYKLLPVRDALKARKASMPASAWGAQQENELSAVRAELKKLISVWGKTGYQYTGAIYREISMQNSDYGGMENVGNTTILASRMVPSDLLADLGYLYMEGVKIHEYYHNINGSQVTGESPFEIWLNEAVTVHIQRQRESVLFGGDFMRLKEVLYSFVPGQGPLAIDSGANAMPIEPRGFNRTQELISAMTYSKAPEFVRMVELLIGTEAFNRGLDHYHTKFSYSNATTADWIRSMETASGAELMPMADRWLRRSGHPHVLYSGVYDAAAQTYTLSMEQTRLPAQDPTPWILPVDWALVKDGKVLQKGVYRLAEAKATLVIPNVSTAPDFLSFARQWSFFGTHENTAASKAALTRQALTDPDIINRYFAYRAIVDAEKAAVIEALKGGSSSAAVAISDDLVKLHATILFDETVSAGARASLLREGEDIHTRPDLSYLYWEISDARLALLQAVYDAHAEKIIALYTDLQKANKRGPHLNQLHDRALKHHLLTLIAAGNRPKSILATRTPSPIKADVSALAKDLLTSSFMSDKLFAFSTYLSGPASREEKAAVMAQVREQFSAHPDSIETYVGVLSSLDSDDAPQLIRALIADKKMFDVNQAGHARTAVRGWAAQRKRSLLSAEGRDLTVDLFLLIGKVNQYSAQSFIAALNDLAKFPRDTQTQIVQAVRKMHAGLDPVKEESLNNQLTALLAPYKDL